MPRTPYSSKATSPLLNLDWSTPSKSCETNRNMTNELLLNNLHLIRFAVARSVQAEDWHMPPMDPESKKELLEFLRELEKQEITGDSP